ncbi:cyclase family protein [bacterium]|nr:MAG: cyclase family protein [bacterium]
MSEHDMRRPRAWERWGEGDQLGALNLLTPERVLAALRIPKTGRVYRLGLLLDAGVPLIAGRTAPQHFMTSDGGDYVARGRSHGTMIADDFLAMGPSVGTHIDSLAHVWHDGLMYGGVPGTEVRSSGAKRNGIENAGAVVARGVLLDIAAHQGVEILPESFEIEPALLESCSSAQGVEVGAADVVLLRTGWLRAYQPNTRWEFREPGIGLAAARWLAERDVCVVGADNAGIEVTPVSGTTAVPVHVELLRDRGIYLLEMCTLDELSHDRAYEFLFVASPLAIDGGIASPLQPLAII